MADKSTVIGLFGSVDKAVSTIEALKNSKWTLERVHSPFPEHRIIDALGLKKSRVGLFTLAGGILGFLFGFALAIFTATRWHLIVSGKPVVALVPFLIVGFEFTILFSVLGNILGFMLLAGLPDYKGLRHHEPKCTGDRFGIVAASAEGEGSEGLMAFFQEHGGESKLVEEGQEIPAP